MINKTTAFVLAFLCLKESDLLLASAPQGAGAQSTGKCGMLYNDPFAALNNPSYLPFLKNKGIAFSTGNYYTLASLRDLSIVAVKPTGSMGFGMFIRTTGNEILRENEYGVSVAGLLHPRFSLGYGARLKTISVNNYGRSHFLLGEMSSTSKLSNKSSCSFRVYNIFKGAYKSEVKKKGTMTGNFAFMYNVNKELTLFVEIEKYLGFKPGLKSGLLYVTEKQIRFSFGFSGPGRELTMGFGFEKSGRRIQSAIIVHSQLGISSNISLQYAFK